MIKCPNCGSTSQVREVGTRYLNAYTERSYECGCRCRFTLEFHDKYNTIRGRWEINYGENKKLFQPQSHL